MAGAYSSSSRSILLYLAIMSGRLSRTERELGELTELAARRRGDPGGAGESDVRRP